MTGPTLVRGTQILINLPQFRQDLAKPAPSATDPLAAELWVLPYAPVFAVVHRNGIAQAPGVDYTLGGEQIRFAAPIGADETVLVVGY